MMGQILNKTGDSLRSPDYKEDEEVKDHRILILLRNESRQSILLHVSVPHHVEQRVDKVKKEYNEQECQEHISVRTYFSSTNLELSEEAYIIEDERHECADKTEYNRYDGVDCVHGRLLVC
jgi:methylase of polypeptide subunit release factors